MTLGAFLAGDPIVDPSQISGLIGELSQLSTSDPDYIQGIARLAVASRVKNFPEDAGNARTKMLNRIDKMPVEIQKDLLSGKRQIVDHVIKVAKSINLAGDIELFQASDAKKRGVCTINKKQLEKGQIFLVEKARLNYGVSTAANGTETTNDGAAIIEFRDSVIPPAIFNGEFSFKVDANIFAENEPLCAFDQTGKTTEWKNTFVFSSPKIIKDQVDINFDIKFAAAAPAKSFLSLELHGAIVAKNNG